MHRPLPLVNMLTSENGARIVMGMQTHERRTRTRKFAQLDIERRLMIQAIDQLFQTVRRRRAAERGLVLQ